jgi:protein tyrosine phosphatase (PTP) superfamily phosphohydrolase (DUF442 family)
LILALSLAANFLAVSHHSVSAEPKGPASAPQAVDTGPPSEGFPRKIASDLDGLNNLIEVQDRIFSGSEPHGKIAFTTLQKLGVKTIVSVDGARPDTELAREFGLRYVHIPIGYDRIPDEAGAALTRVVREIEGPIYFHCHHGKHRGPAAAAIACLASGKTSGETALKFLELAGTGKEYAGLWRDVAAFLPPAADARLPELVERAEVDSLSAAMAGLDRQWDNLKLCRDAGWRTPRDHPDLDPPQAALLVREAFTEAVRGLGTDPRPELKKWLADAQSQAQAIETDLAQARYEQLAPKLQALEQSCKTCHAKFRN